MGGLKKTVKQAIVRYTLVKPRFHVVSTMKYPTSHFRRVCATLGIFDVIKFSTSDIGDRCIAIFYFTVENTVDNTIKATSA